MPLFRKNWSRQPPQQTPLGGHNKFARNCIYAFMPGWQAFEITQAGVGANNLRPQVQKYSNSRLWMTQEKSTGTNTFSVKNAVADLAHMGSARVARFIPGTANNDFGCFRHQHASYTGWNFPDPFSLTLLTIFKTSGNGGIGGGSDPRIVVKSNSNTEASHDFLLGIDDNGTRSAGRVRLRLGSTVRTLITTTHIQDDAVNMVAGIVRPFGTAGTQTKAYCVLAREDGQYDEDTDTEVTGSYNPRADNTYPIQIGGNLVTNDSPFAGDLLGVWAFNWGMSQEECLEFFKNPFLIYQPRSVFIPFDVAGSIQLVVAEALLSQTADSPALTQASTLTVAEAAQSIASDNVALTQAHTLAMAEALLSMTADGDLALTQKNTLTVAEALLSMTADNTVLTVGGLLTVADALLSMTSDNIALTQKNTLAVAEALLSMTSDNTDLSTGITLDMQAAALAMTSDNIALTQKNTLAVAEALLAVTVDNLDLAAKYTLTVAEAALSMTADAPDVTPTATLTVAEALMSCGVDALALTQKHVLVAEDALHALTADGVTLTPALIVSDALMTMLADTVRIGDILERAEAVYVIDISGGRHQSIFVVETSGSIRIIKPARQ